MEEKKLTDEEIIKALEICVSTDTCDGCPIRKQKYCQYPAELYKKILDLIHRLQSEKDELQKQVEALSLDLENWKKAAYGYKYAEEQAVKDTAKEILQGLIDKAYVNECIDLTIKEVKAWFREDYGVEVE